MVSKISVSFIINFLHFIFQPEWQKREQELLKRIEDLEKVKNQSAGEGLQFELKVTDQIFFN